jgi:RecJ-like exonuclease
MSYSHDWRAVEDEVPCRKCAVAGQIEYREWESSCGGHEDYHYRCRACGADWWCEGADA